MTAPPEVIGDPLEKVESGVDDKGRVVPGEGVRLVRSDSHNGDSTRLPVS